MAHEGPRRVVEYRTPPEAEESSFRPADAYLLGVFVLYAVANVAVVTRAFPPWNAFLAFAIPLPLVFIVIVVLAHFLASPPLFNRWVLLAIAVLVIIEAIINIYVAAEVSASV